MGRAFGKALAIFAVLVLVFPALVISVSPKWVYSAANKYVFLSSTSEEKTIFFATGSGVLAAINKSDGKSLWQVQVGPSVFSNPNFNLGKIYVAPYDGNIQAFDSKTKTQLWSYKTGGSIWGSSPQIYKDTLFVGLENGKLFAINKSDGEEIWEAMTGGPIRSSPLVYMGKVYVGSGNSKMYAFDSETGKKLWEFKADGPIWLSSPAASLNTIFFGSIDGNLYAVSADKGKLIGTFKTDGWVTSTPVAPEGSGFVFFGSNDGYFYALDAQTLALKWKFKTEGPIQGIPKAVSSSRGTVIYFSSNEGQVYALRATSGTKVWSFQAIDWLSTPVIEENFVYFTSYEGKIYAVSILGCTVTSPTENFAISDDYLIVNGTGSSTESIKSISLRVNEGSWKTAQGTTEWSANLSLEGIQYGTFEVECSATDSAGKVEPAPYTTVKFVKKEFVPLKEMQVTSPKESNVEQKIRIEVLGEDGAPLKGSLVKIGSAEYITGDDGVAELALKDPGKREIEITYDGYSKKTVEIEVKQEISLITYLYVLVGVMAVVVVLLQLKRRKP